MRLVGQLARDQPAYGLDLLLRNLGGFAAEGDESHRAVRTKRIAIATLIIDIDEEITFEKRLFDDLITIAPTAADAISWKKCFDILSNQLLKNAFFMAGTSIDRVPMRHKTRYTFTIFSRPRETWRVSLRVSG